MTDEELKQQTAQVRELVRNKYTELVSGGLPHEPVMNALLDGSDKASPITSAMMLLALIELEREELTRTGVQI